MGADATPPLLMDGHVHVTNRVYWEKADLWQPRDGGFTGENWFRVLDKVKA